MIEVLSIALHGAAGLSLFLLLLNRCLIRMKDSPWKALIILFTFALIMGACFFSAWYRPGLPWIYFPAGILCLAALGEVRRALIRRRCVADGPKEKVHYPPGPSGPWTTTDLVCHRYEVSFPEWRGPGFRVVHLTDFHLHPGLPAQYFHHVMERAEQAEADLAFLTGDYVKGLESLPRLARLLRPLGRLGTFAVLGNHDYWADGERIGERVRHAGIHLLVNESHRLSMGTGKIRITGHDYPWGAGKRTIPFGEEGELHLVLSHNPDNIYALEKADADCVFSGHYHAGQIRLPFAGSLVVPSVYGRRFDHGHFKVGGSHLFVPAGVGAANPALRICCPADIFVVDIRGAEEEGEGAPSPYLSKRITPRANFPSSISW